MKRMGVRKLNWLEGTEHLFLSCADPSVDFALQRACTALMTVENGDACFQRFRRICATAQLNRYEQFCVMACVAAQRNRQVNEIVQDCRMSALQKLGESLLEPEAEPLADIDFSDPLKALIFGIRPSPCGNRLELLQPIGCYIEGSRAFIGLISGYARLSDSFSETTREERTDAYFSRLGERSGKEILLMRGGDTDGLIANLGAAASAQGYRLLRVDAQALIRMDDPWRSGRELAGTVLITNAVLCLTEADLLPSADRRRLLRLLLEHLRFLAVVSRELTEFDLSESGCTVCRLEQILPDAPQRLQYWQAETRRQDPAAQRRLLPLADRFRFTRGQIAKAVQAAQISWTGADEETYFYHLQQAAMGMIGFSMGEYAAEVQGRYDWKDIVISDDCRMALQDACNRITYQTRVYDEWKLMRRPAYGNGVSMLFYGPPGTGKTMAAQVVAREVGCALYKIDLSQIMDKYVGESEKKLKEIFANAAKANIMLLFDEADSLFSKRTEVGSANDRYANTQTAFLLQQIEEYDGVSVLTTNCAGNFDEAFKRRIQYFVSFPMPDVGQRLELWQKAIPKDFGIADELNLDFLAEQFELSGSSIRSIVTSAVFKAVGMGEKLSREHLRLALREELLKQGRVYMTSDFVGYRPLSINGCESGKEYLSHGKQQTISL